MLFEDSRVFWTDGRWIYMYTYSPSSPPPPFSLYHHPHDTHPPQNQKPKDLRNQQHNTSRPNTNQPNPTQNNTQHPTEPKRQATMCEWRIWRCVEQGCNFRTSGPKRCSNVKLGATWQECKYMKEKPHFIMVDRTDESHFCPARNQPKK